MTKTGFVANTNKDTADMEIATETKKALAPFPNGKTVPFPYETPYPQQEALMDTLLLSLQNIELRERQRHEEQEQKDPKLNNANDFQKNCETDNVVMLLESPTGTGKSLSLACASLAWLKHMEEVDLQVSSISYSKDNDRDSNNQEQKEITSSKPNSVPNSTSSSSWLDSYANDWANPSKINLQKKREERKKSIKTAKIARIALEEELSSIRSKINHITMSYNNPNDKQSNNNNDHIQQMKTSRQNLTRAAVTAALIEERKKRRRMMKRKTRNGVKASSSAVKQTSNIHDFCIDDYYSNEEDNQSGNDDSSVESTGSRISRNHPHTTSNPTSQVERFSSLLHGSALDGSNANSNHSFSNRKVFRSVSSTDSFTNAKVTTVGDVEPGSGVRKIIYAARTHSQLSQFIGEIKRTKWGKSIRVITLGSRKLLCGNKEVLGSTSYRSETRITEDCLDLQKGLSSSSNKTKRKRASDNKGCPLLSSKDAISTLAVHMLAQPSDIEDLANLGASSHCCSYYASRVRKVIPI